MVGFGNYYFQIAIFASKGVGKKSLKDYFGLQFKSNTAMTMGVEFLGKKMEVEGQMIKLSIQLFFYEEFQDIRKDYLFPMASRRSGVILLYDITDRRTFDILSEWCQKIKRYREDIPIFLVGNKIDLKGFREVTEEQVDQFKKANKIFTSVEISIKTGENVEEVLKGIIRVLLFFYSHKSENKSEKRIHTPKSKKRKKR
ncbi:MAG: Rab family GTPase [Candidatus Odinarchaeota archaeon]